MPSRHPLHRPFAVAVMAACGVLTSVAIAQAQQAPAPTWVRAAALDPEPESRVEGAQVINDTLAAAVIGAISTRFGERQVEVRLDTVDVEPASLRDRHVTGSGRLRIGDDPTWIAFQFDTFFDTRNAVASAPALVLGDPDPASRAVELEHPLARELDQQVDAALDAEFPAQPVELVTTRVIAAEMGGRYLQVKALGTADFAAEGTTPAQIVGLYDRQADEWVRVDYELGTTSNWAEDESDPTVAVR
jgi:hypothetical protein